MNVLRGQNRLVLGGSLHWIFQALKQQDGKDIWLVGGGQVITLLLNHDLVDEMQICYIPVILGNGIPLFPNQPKESTWKFAGSEAYDSGIVKITYVIG